MLLALLMACPPEAKDTGGDEPPVAPLAPPWFAIAGATVDGAFKSTCTMSATLANTEGAEVDSLTLSPADGGRWSGVALEPGLQLKATLSWDDCENTPDGTGSFTSSTFSGSVGDLFVLHYDGVDAGFEWMVQADDHLGGEVHAQFEADASNVDALVESLGLSSRADDADATFRYLSWTDDRNVAEVLGALSGDASFAWGEPVWVEKPAWW